MLDSILKIIEILTQLALVFFAYKALSSWRREVRGRDRYDNSKKLLHYVGDLRFMIRSKDSLHSVVLNDLVSESDFYHDQISLIRDDQIYFDASIFSLFLHINTRSDFFLSDKVRSILDQLIPSSLKIYDGDREDVTYLTLFDDFNKDDFNSNFLDKEKLKSALFVLGSEKRLTVSGYFKIWEDLVRELKSLV